jgi:hypothetical protein
VGCLVAAGLVGGFSQTAGYVRDLMRADPAPPASFDKSTLRSWVTKEPETGRWIQHWSFDAEVREVCGAQDFTRTLTDHLGSTDVEPQMVLKAAGEGKRFGLWLPPGRHPAVDVAVVIEAGRKGNLILWGLADFCPSGFDGYFSVYQLPYDWTEPRFMGQEGGGHPLASVLSDPWLAPPP